MNSPLQKTKKEYDIVIIGAGPAGANLARLLTDSVHSILLIDGSKYRGEKVCAGLLSPDAQSLLAKYDYSLPSDLLASPQLFSVRTIDLGSDNIPVRRYKRSYLNIDRAGFDRFLREKIPPDTEVLEADCRSVIREESGGFLLTVRTEYETENLRAKIVIGADGASSIVRRTLFPAQKIKKYIAIQQWFEGRAEDSCYSCIFDAETSESCSWIFFKDGKLVFGGAFSPNSCREAFEKQKQKLWHRGFVHQNAFRQEIKTEACMVSRPQLFRGVFLGSNGAFLVGEAAGFISPSSFEGISYALSSAEALAKALAKTDIPAEAARQYRKSTRGLRLKLKIKCLKAALLSSPPLRALVLRSGICSLRESACKDITARKIDISSNAKGESSI